MEHITTQSGLTISYDLYGAGPPLVLVHGSFSDHRTNWQEVKHLLKDRFTVYAVARRGRGETSATEGHAVEDEAADVAAVLRHIGTPAFLLGHSYGALCALGAAASYPSSVRRLVLYEPPPSTLTPPDVLARLEELASRGDWDGVVHEFMLNALQVPPDEVRAIRATGEWALWTADAKASLFDLRAIANHRVDMTSYRLLDLPVLLLTGTESPRHLYLTDALASALPNARIRELEGQAHEGMTRAPAQFMGAISEFL